MQELVIYHNPKCSKSRATLEILQAKGLKPVIIEYLKNPLDLEQLHALSTHFSLQEFVRTDEVVFKELKLSLDDKNTVLDAIVKHPQLMQRPIVVYMGKAAIGRPPGNIFTLLNL